MSKNYVATTAFEVYIGDSALPIGTASFELGDVSFATQEIAQSGVAGSYTVPLHGHVQGLSATLNFLGSQDSLWKLLRSVSDQIILSSAQQYHDTETGGMLTKSLKVIMKGSPTSFNLGSFSVNSRQEIAVPLALTRVAIYEDGAEKVVIDPANFVYNVGGVDHLAGTRAALR